MFNNTLTEDKAFLCPIDGAIMITASHLPFNRNGFKFFTNIGGLGKPDIKDILECATDIYNNFTDEGLMKSREPAFVAVKRVDYMNVYTSDIVKVVRKAAGNTEKPLEGFHIIVDAGNGAGGFFAFAGALLGLIALKTEAFEVHTSHAPMNLLSPGVKRIHHGDRRIKTHRVEFYSVIRGLGRLLP